MLKNRRLTPNMVLLVIAILLILFPMLSGNKYYLRTITTLAIAIVLTSGFRLIALTGQLSIAQAAFMGVGAYCSTLLIMNLGWNSWICFFLAGFAAALTAGIVGFITLRIKEIYFAIATLALNELFRLIWVEWDTLFGGPAGIVNIPSPDPILGIHFGSVVSFYYIAVLLLFSATAMMLRIERSRIGLIFSSIREFDTLAASLGVNLIWEKVKAFMIACFFAGMAGALYAHLQHFISPVDFTLMDSVMFLLYGVIGGLESVWGPAVGCTVMIFIPVGLRLIPNYNPVIEPIIFGGILILVMRFCPGGLVGLFQKLVSDLKKTESQKGEQEHAAA
ncbi:MAG: branched-chain amino acid ABC transporter permease [Deltaproteobacteria bacterium]|nr:branched-chain amino acid ABC transporter permease [Deltaproteobacteria bacterium]